MEDRILIFRQIHEIVFYGNGGYDWDTVYNMPLWLRKTTFNLLKEHYDKEKEEIDKQQSALINSNKKDIARPNIAPNYIAKAPRK